MNHGENIFLSLNRWASAHDENFATEALVFLLRHLLRCHPTIASGLLCKLTGGALDVDGEDVEQVSISTQAVTDHGVPDIEIAKADCLVYIEVKVSAAPDIRQLRAYSRALKRSCVTRTGLVLLSPYPLREAGPAELVQIQWYQVADWLEQIVTDSRIEEPSNHLTVQFIEFLKGKYLMLGPVRSSVSAGLRASLSRAGAESVLLTRVRGLAVLESDPDLRPLHDLLVLVGEALRSIGLRRQISLDSGQHHGGWIAYNINRMEYFVSIYYTRPDILVFETLKRRVDRDRFHDQPGYLEVRWTNILKWFHELDLAAPELDFFGRKRDQQIGLIRDFVVRSIEVAEEISDPE